jgi:hypothetical protein
MTTSIRHQRRRVKAKYKRLLVDVGLQMLSRRQWRGVQAVTRALMRGGLRHV